jgi:hypothetical protein
MRASADQSHTAAVSPKFLCFCKNLGEWIEHSILKVVDGQIRWNGGISSRMELRHSIVNPSQFIRIDRPLLAAPPVIPMQFSTVTIPKPDLAAALQPPAVMC